MRAVGKPEGWYRRDVLKLGAGATAGVLGGRSRGEPVPPGPTRPVLRTPLCDLLGIEYPLLQAPMGGVSLAPLAAAVSRAGGLGLIAGAGLPPEELRRQIQALRALTDRPFGVNLILHPEAQQPVDPATLDEARVRAVQDVLDRFRRRLGLPAAAGRPPAVPAIVAASIEVILAERVPVFSIGLGRPAPELVARCRERGVKLVAMAATVPDAVELAAAGVDAVVAQGGEAGGHRSTWIKRERPERATIGTLALVPQVVDALRVPVIAAGGIMDGRQVAAALALGAQGVLMGTRFISSHESAAPDFYKQAVLQRDSDATTLTDAFTGLYARVLRNAYADEYAASGAPVLPALLQQAAARDVTSAAAARGDGGYYPLYAGQGLGLAREPRGAEEIVAGVVREARARLAALAALAPAGA